MLIVSVKLNELVENSTNFQFVGIFYQFHY